MTQGIAIPYINTVLYIAQRLWSKSTISFPQKQILGMKTMEQRTERHTEVVWTLPLHSTYTLIFIAGVKIHKLKLFLKYYK